jgi:L-histidine Nalpha-methyltransferase
MARSSSRGRSSPNHAPAPYLVRPVPAASVEHAVRAGLLRADKQLPPWLFYDAEGSRLYERITELPEYYLTRAEWSIFQSQGDAIIAGAANGTAGPLDVAELGAGTATKSLLLLQATVRRQGRTTFMPTDVSAEALAIAAERIAREEPRVTVRPVVGHHEQALLAIRTLEQHQLVLFIGSSIGNYEEDDARALLRAVRQSLRVGGALLLGTDLRKDPAALVRAYDDAQGVTAAFDKNVLARINRELGGGFDLDSFRHVAVWNEAQSRIEMHLESLVDQTVRIAGLHVDVPFRRGERIHTESSVKYDDAMVDTLLGASGFARETTLLDADERFAVHLARAR